MNGGNESSERGANKAAKMTLSNRECWATYTEGILEVYNLTGLKTTMIFSFNH